MMSSMHAAQAQRAMALHHAAAAAEAQRMAEVQRALEQSRKQQAAAAAAAASAAPTSKPYTPDTASGTRGNSNFRIQNFYCPRYHRQNKNGSPTRNLSFFKSRKLECCACAYNPFTGFLHFVTNMY